MKHSLLIVDDNEMLLKLLKKLFEKSFIVHAATDGVEAMSLLYQGIKPSLIISDLNMQHINGYDLIRHLATSSIYNKIPVIILTGSVDTSTINIDDHVTVANILAKPFDPIVLEGMIKDAIEFYYEDFNRKKFPILNKMN
jgi:two-component system chemotaxis response regulator CheY